jgi:hypothetical protein
MPRIIAPPSRGLLYVVVIPAYLEKNIFDTLDSIKNTKSIDDSVEVLIVVNFSEKDSPENKIANEIIYRQLVKWSDENSKPMLRFFTLLARDLPSKHAGAGLARKIGMDEAVHRFGLMDRPEGIILSLDADTLVAPDYFTAVVSEFGSKPEFGGCILPFAHPISGKEFSSKIYDAVVLYELHLRYYKRALQLAGFPYARYTIGSCFGVRAGFYSQMGGMNRRKAGEDFYFLNKLFPHSDFCEIKGTCVYPSPRPSKRVPFGTGPVIQKLVESGIMKYETYCLQAFLDLRILFNSVEILYESNDIEVNHFLQSLPDSLRDFLNQNNFPEKIGEIKKNTASVRSFNKRFFLWFDGFKVVKFLNDSHKEHYQKTDVIEAVKQLQAAYAYSGFKDDARILLEFMRELEIQSRITS